MSVSVPFLVKMSKPSGSPLPVAQPVHKHSHSQPTPAPASTAPTNSPSPSSNAAAVAPVTRPAMPMAMPVCQPVARSSPQIEGQTNDQPAAPPVSTSTASSSSVSTSSSSSSSSSLSSPSGDNVDAFVVADLPGVELYTLKDGQKRYKCQGLLQILCTHVDGKEVYVVIQHDESGKRKMEVALRKEVPLIEMAQRNFVLPTDKKTYAIVIPDAISSDVFDVFHYVLSENSSFGAAASPQPIASLPTRPDRVVTTAQKVAERLGSGSVVVATGVVKGGAFVGGLLTKGGAMLTKRLKPAEEPKKISPSTKQKLARAHMMTGAACKVSKALLMGALATTEALSKQLSAAIKDTETGKKLVSDPNHPNERLDAAKQLGEAALTSVLTIYEAVEQAVWGVAGDAAQATVTVVKHRYGAEAGESTQQGLGVVGNVAQAARDMRHVGVKAIAKKTAIKAGQNILKVEKQKEGEASVDAHASSSSGSSSALGEAMGLPAGMDPLTAVEAMTAVATLKRAAQDIQASSSAPSASSSDERVAVAAAVATAPTHQAAVSIARSAAEGEANQALKRS